MPQPRLAQFSVVSWDVDGTLYSLPAMVSSLTWIGVKRIFKAEFCRTATECNVLRRFRRHMDGVRARVGVLPQKTDCSSVQKRLSIEKRWYGEAIRRIGVRNGVRDALDGFHKAGLIQIAVSDYDCSYKLNALGLEEYFDHVYAGERLGFVKPSPALFATVTDQLCIDPACLLHIGDRRDRDGIAASKAGCNVLILGEDFRSFLELHTRLRQ